MTHIDKLTHLSPPVRNTLKAAVDVCEAWEDKPRDNEKVRDAVKALKGSLQAFALGDTRQVHAEDPRQKGPI